MKKNKIQTKKRRGRFCGMLCIAALAAFALFASCERPEPELEPPTPPVVDPDTLPTNKFIGTWVLCAMNDVNSEPPATCDLADATTDTLVFVDDSRLTIHHGVSTLEYRYESTEHFLIRYHYEDSTPEPDGSIQYYFRGNDEELVLRGIFPLIGKNNFCFHRIVNE